jgi:catechol 2,3-dioxygenase-like lactoylglutathione lyase family enzyme
MRFDHVAHQVPDVAKAIEWWQEMVPETEVLYQDATWGLIEAGGLKLALVDAGEHPSHLAWRVSNERLEELAARYEMAIHPHRDGTRSFYLEAPGAETIELIAYPDPRD